MASGIATQGNRSDRRHAYPGQTPHIECHFTGTATVRDIVILKGEYAVKQGLILGHEAVGIMHEVGQGITDCKAGDGVLVGAITPCGQCGARIPP